MKPFVGLILIDIQEGFNDPFWGGRNNPYFEENVSTLLIHWRRLEMPVIHVQHFSTELGSPLHPGRGKTHFMDCAEPLVDELIVRKNVNSAFIGTDLESILKRERIGHLVFAGLTTDHCVSTSVRMAKNLEFQTMIISDATATFNRNLSEQVRFDAETVHRVSLASLNGEFADIRSTKEILCHNFNDLLRKNSNE
jgi:nicotinamidase-related amidase